MLIYFEGAGVYSVDYGGKTSAGVLSPDEPFSAQTSLFLILATNAVLTLFSGKQISDFAVLEM